MAQAYTTKRGKNKKGKLGMRKDAANNAANKLNNQIKADNPLLSIFDDDAPKVLSLGSAEQRKKTALLKAQEKLQMIQKDNQTAQSNSLSGNPDKCNFINCPSSAPELKTQASQSADASTEQSTETAEPPKKLLQCGGCRLAYYCCAACQKADWVHHKVACKTQQAIVKALQAPAAAEAPAPVQAAT